MKPVEIEILLKGNFARALSDASSKAASAGKGLDTLGEKGRAAGKGLDTLGEKGRASGKDLDTLGEKGRAAGKDLDTLGEKGRAAGRAVSRSMDEMGDAASRLEGLLKGAIGAFSAKEFIGQVIDARSEIESLEVSFETLLGDKGKGDALFSQLMDYEVKTPLVITDLAKAAQTMLGFNVAAGDVMPVLKAIGDISMGDSERFQSLSLAFSQMSATGKLMGQDLLQMINAGFNPLMVMSEKTGKSISELKDEMSKGSISAGMVKDAFLSAAGAGGQFNGMLDKMSQTTQGQLSNLKGSITYMLNDIGKATEGLTSGAIGGLNELVQNYESVGKSLLELVGFYGAYRAALVVATTVSRTFTVAELAQYAALEVTRKAQSLLNATILKNPYVAAAAALAALTVAVVSFATRTTAAEKSQRMLDSATREMTQSVVTEEAQIDTMFGRLKAAKKGTEEWKSAKQAILNQYGQYLSGLSKEIRTLEDVAGAYNAVRRAAIASAKARARDAFTKSADDDYVKQTGELRKRMQEQLVGRYGSKKGNELFWKISLQLESGKLDSAMRSVVRGFDEIRGSAQGVAGSVSSYVYNPLQALIGEATEARVTLDRVTREATERFGSDDASSPDTKKSSPATRNKRYYEDEVKKAQGEYDALTVAERNSEKGKKIAQRIRENQKIIDGYNVGKTDRSSSSSSKAAISSESKALEQQRALREEESRWASEAAKARANALYAEEEARISQIKDSGERERAERELQYRKDLDQLKTQEAEYRRQNYEHEKKMYESGAGAAGSRGKRVYQGSPGTTALTDDQARELSARREKLEADYTRWQGEELARRASAAREAMSDYLKAYGTTEERRYAIAQEYARKIASVEQGPGSSEEKRWRVRSLEGERDRALDGNAARSLAMGVDWSKAFDGVGNVLGEIARETLRKVESYMRTDDFKSLSAEGKKSYSDLRSQLLRETGGDSTGVFNFGIWSQVNKDARAYQSSVSELSRRTSAHAEAVRQLETAEAALAGTTDKTSRRMTEASVAAARAAVESTGEAQRSAESDKETAEQALTDSTTRAANGLRNFTSYLGELSDGSLSGFANGMSKLVTSLAKGSDGVGKSLGELGGKIAGLVGAILQILDALGDDPTGFIDGLFDKVTATIEKVLSDLPQLGVSVVKGVGGLLGGIVDGVGGMFGLGGIFGGNGKAVQALTDRLTKSNEALTGAVDRLKESIDRQGGSAAVRNYESAYADQESVIRNTMDILRAQMGHHGRHHSNAHYWDLDSSDYAAINATLRRYSEEHPNDVRTSRESVGSLWDIYELTPEQMQAISTHNIEIWQKMLDAGKYDKSEYWENYIKLAGTLEELTEQVNENLTQVSFSSLKDSFVSDIMDMDKTAEDFADGFTEMMAKAWTNAAVNDLMSESLRRFYDEWSGKMKDGELTEGDISALRSEYERLVDEALGLRSTLSEVTGYTGHDSVSQSGRSGSFTAMTQDQGTKLEGLFTSNLRHLSGIDQTLAGMSSRMSSVEGYLSRMAENSDHLRRLDDIADGVTRIRRDGVKAL